MVSVGSSGPSYKKTSIKLQRIYGLDAFKEDAIKIYGRNFLCCEMGAIKNAGKIDKKRIIWKHAGCKKHCKYSSTI